MDILNTLSCNFSYYKLGGRNLTLSEITLRDVIRELTNTSHPFLKIKPVTFSRKNGLHTLLFDLKNENRSFYTINARENLVRYHGESLVDQFLRHAGKVNAELTPEEREIIKTRVVALYRLGKLPSDITLGDSFTVDQQSFTDEEHYISEMSRIDNVLVIELLIKYMNMHIRDRLQHDKSYMEALMKLEAATYKDSYADDVLEYINIELLF
jgi:hypothetical protein